MSSLLMACRCVMRECWLVFGQWHGYVVLLPCLWVMVALSLWAAMCLCSVLCTGLLSMNCLCTEHWLVISHTFSCLWRERDPSLVFGEGTCRCPVATVCSCI